MRKRLSIRRELALARETIRLQKTYSDRLTVILEQSREAREIDLSHIQTLEGLLANKDQLLANKDEQVEVYREQVANLHNVLEERAQGFHEQGECECKTARVYRKQVKSLEKLANSSRSLIKYLHNEIEKKEEENQRRDTPPSPPPPTRSDSPVEDGEIVQL